MLLYKDLYHRIKAFPYVLYGFFYESLLLSNPRNEYNPDKSLKQRKLKEF